MDGPAKMSDLINNMGMTPVFDKATGKYKITCKFCKTEFLGRLNQKYHPKCKIAANNQIASKNNAKIKSETNGLKKNNRILSDLLLKMDKSHGELIQIAQNEILRLGFDFKAPYRFIKKDDNTQWYVIGPFHYRVENQFFLFYHIK
ncbi:MAG: hypothetical protein A2W91_05045 [Bacteroidetes bacterium GWF2_38_335]|nr:MAG: hypothetical protein A2W91_05045 [Bacteroidetes bacterium GWF2_38_335]OFY79802.1 MAG: hypothetical protein A2281_10375 [Bacteroidetes bacterium RIFOXYA12_FULL_38_20]HBS88191.1 hypothetical protein [Bacteroidales bacterium]